MAQHIRVRGSAVLLLGVMLAASGSGTAQRGSPGSSSAAQPAQATAGIVAAARAVLSALDDAGRAKIQFAFDNETQRKRWSNLPTGIFQREGVRLGDLTTAQRA